MRIIAGDFKGRRLFTPADNSVRPTTDKVKEALFSIISPNIYDSVVCDLFAGTGNLGLEALSRGAKHCYFSDHAGESMKLIKENIAHCKAEEYATVIHGDFRRALDQIHEPVDIFLLDPPYKNGILESAIEEISSKELLAEGGLIIAEHPKEETLPEELFGFRKQKEKRYGRVVLSIYM
ncbi:MAG: 16S rRNA (guanine(966)-N(2))-methyltransferase RsmD [Anaerovoracaceae bacterium]